jgi:hypothetical protein
VQKMEHLHTLGGKVNQYSHCGKEYEVIKKIKILTSL